MSAHVLPIFMCIYLKGGYKGEILKWGCGEKKKMG